MNRLAVLEKVSFARGLEPEVLEALAGVAHERAIEQGALITMEGEQAEAMYVLAEGRVKIVRHSLEGREQILHVVTPVDHFNAVPVFAGGTCPATTEALQSSVILILSLSEMRQLTQQYSSLSMNLLREFAGRLRMLVGLVENLALHTVNGRVARLLLQQAEAAERGEDVPQMTQAEMAARIGSVREMVGRALKVFEAAGLLRIERGSLEILDRAGLEAQADL